MRLKKNIAKKGNLLYYKYKKMVTVQRLVLNSY